MFSSAVLSSDARRFPSAGVALGPLLVITIYHSIICQTGAGSLLFNFHKHLLGRSAHGLLADFRYPA